MLFFPQKALLCCSKISADNELEFLEVLEFWGVMYVNRVGAVVDLNFGRSPNTNSCQRATYERLGSYLWYPYQHNALILSFMGHIEVSADLWHWLALLDLSSLSENACVATICGTETSMNELESRRAQNDENAFQQIDFWPLFAFTVSRSELWAIFEIFRTPPMTYNRFEQLAQQEGAERGSLVSSTSSYVNIQSWELLFGFLCNIRRILVII